MFEEDGIWQDGWIEEADQLGGRQTSAPRTQNHTRSFGRERFGPYMPLVGRGKGERGERARFSARPAQSYLLSFHGLRKASVKGKKIEAHLFLGNDVIFFGTFQFSIFDVQKIQKLSS